MATDVELGHHPGYLCVTVHGAFDLAGGQQVIQQIVAALDNEMSSILLDLRCATCKLSRADILILVNEMCDNWAVFHQRIGVLCWPNSTIDTSDFLELCAGNRGFRVRTFRDAELVQQWLAEVD